MVILKSRCEIDLMQAAGQLVARAHAVVRELLEPGVSTGEIDAAVESLYIEHGAVPLFKGFPGVVPFPAVTCISVNEEVAHGIPGTRRLREGDIVSVDTACQLNGWCADAAWTYPVGAVDSLKRRLLDAGLAVLETAIFEMGRQNRWSRVARAMQQAAGRAGFCMVEELMGHGIGREMHEDPQVPSGTGFRWRRHDFRLEPGLVLAIEPMVTGGKRHLRVLADHWTVETADRRPSVHFEHTVALTPDGPQVLTAGIGGGALPGN